MIVNTDKKDDGNEIDYDITCCKTSNDNDIDTVSCESSINKKCINESKWY